MRKKCILISVVALLLAGVFFGSSVAFGAQTSYPIRPSDYSGTAQMRTGGVMHSIGGGESSSGLGIYVSTKQFPVEGLTLSIRVANLRYGGDWGAFFLSPSAGWTDTDQSAGLFVEIRSADEANQSNVIVREQNAQSGFAQYTVAVPIDSEFVFSFGAIEQGSCVLYLNGEELGKIDCNKVTCLLSGSVYLGIGSAGNGAVIFLDSVKNGERETVLSMSDFKMIYSTTNNAYLSDGLSLYADKETAFALSKTATELNDLSVRLHLPDLVSDFEGTYGILLTDGNSFDTSDDTALLIQLAHEKKSGSKYTLDRLRVRLCKADGTVLDEEFYYAAISFFIDINLKKLTEGENVGRWELNVGSAQPVAIERSPILFDGFDAEVLADGLGKIGFVFIDGPKFVNVLLPEFQGGEPIVPPSGGEEEPPVQSVDVNLILALVFGGLFVVGVGIWGVAVFRRKKKA